MARFQPPGGDALQQLIEAVEQLIVRTLAAVTRAAASFLRGRGTAETVTGEDLGVVPTLWAGAVDADLVPALDKVWQDAAGHVAGQMTAADLVAELKAPDAAEFLRTARSRFADVGDTLWERAREQLAQGVEAGESMPELAERVRSAAGLTESLALIVARTEVISACNAASIAQARMLDDSTMIKEWLATNDDRTRPAHHVADGQRVPIGDPFRVGDALLDYPGDPTGPPDQTRSCRCSMAFDVDDDVVTAASSPTSEPTSQPIGTINDGEPTEMPSVKGQGPGPADDFHLTGQHDQTTHGNRQPKPAPTEFADPPPAEDPPAAPEPVEEVVPEHTGAMIALVPSDADVERLAVDGGEPAGELHCTLLYLGEAADIPDDARQQLLDQLTTVLAGWPVVDADVFSVSLFNPGPSDPEPCAVYLLGGEELDHIHGLVEDVVTDVVDEHDDTDPADPATVTWEPPEQHSPWHPHVTAQYSPDHGQLDELIGRVGPVVFDRVRVSFAGEYTDIPLSAEPDLPGDGEDEVPDVMLDAAVAAATAAAFQSHMPAVLQRYWLKRLAPWGHGSFRRCVAQIAHYFPKDPKGTCANLVHEATGHWPGEDHHDAAGDTVMTAGTEETTMTTAPAAIPTPDEPECPEGQHYDPEIGKCVADTPAVDAASTSTDMAVEAPVTVAAPAGDDVDCPEGKHYDPDAGECVDDDATESDAAVPAGPEHFHAVMHVEGVSTGMRMFEVGSLTWRTPPFAFHWQRNSSAHGGQPETVQVGVVTRVERDGATIRGWGRLDLGCPEGVDYARRLMEGFSAWVSIGLDESPADVEYVWPEEADEGEGGDEIGLLFAEPEQMIFSSGRIGELTAVSVPAQAEAVIEPTQELLDQLAQMGVLVAAAVAEHETPTSTADWDGAAAEAALPSPLPLDTAKAVYAWVDDARADGDTIAKDACKFPHHEVNADGTPGAANLTACTAVIAALHGGRGGADIPDDDRKGVFDHVAKHLTDGGQEAPPFEDGPLVAAGHIIELPDVPPAWWFTRPSDVTPHGALTVTDEGRIYGYLAPANIAHRAFKDRRVTAPMGRVDYDRWMGRETIVAGGGRVVTGVITMECGHLSPNASANSGVRMEHYENSCSVFATACIGEDQHGVWIAGALSYGVTAEQVSKVMACALSGDWAPHPERPGWQEFVAALLVPVPGFPMARSAPSVRIREGALVAAAVPVRFETADGARPDLRPALERVARSIGRDAGTRLSMLRRRVHAGEGVKS